MFQQFKASAFARRLFFISPITLGLGRIALALLLLVDVLRRWTDLDVWYTNAGLMPNHTMLWAPQERLSFSIFFSVSQLHEARFFVLLIIGVYLSLLVGYRTRLMQVLALIAQVSLNARVHYLTNGGDSTLSALLLWTAFLPLGDWLSVDALRRKLRASRLVLGSDGTASLKIDPQHAALFEKPWPRFEWVAGALVAQLVVIYFFNWIHKDGPGWAEGRVVLDVLHQDRIVTALGVMVRPYLTETTSVVMTRAALFTEAGLPLLLLVPVLPLPAPVLLWVRRLTVLAGIGLHLGFTIFLNLGVFQPTMLCLWVFLIPAEDLTRLLGALRHTPKNATLYFDSDCGVCTSVSKALLCMQATSSQPPAFVIKGNETAVREQRVTMAQVEASALWVDGDGRQSWQGHVVAEVARTFAGLRPLAWTLRLGVAQQAYRAFAARRHLVSGFFGMGTCGITHAPEPFEVEPESARAVGRLRSRVAGAALMVVAAAFVIQVLVQNRAVPASIKPEQPFWVAWLVGYTHFYQGWGMFAESPRTDGTVVVRARTVDGRLVDPLSERASPRSPPGISAIEDRLDHDEFFCDYLSKIAFDPPYHAPLRDWVLAYPQRTGRSQDQIVSFDVVQLTDVSPWYGQTASTQRQERVVLHYP